MEQIFSAHRSQLLYKVLAALAALLLAVGIMSGCSSNNGGGSASSSGTANVASSVRVGTMPTEDILPLWVAEAEGLFADYNVDVEIVPFDSAPALSAAITAGEVDMAMTDIMRAVKLCEAGAPVEMEWITLGATSEQGRFGVLVPAGSSVASLKDLAEGGYGVAVAANTVPEYVFDKLCEQAGIDPASIEHLEAPSLPDRFALTATGQYPSASLPNSLLVLGEAQGLTLIADDTQGENISQSVMVARTAWAEDNTGAIEAVARAWDAAVALINDDPNAYRDLLVEKANVNSAVADSYAVSTYPTALSADDATLVRVPADLVEPVLAWMQEKGYTEASVAYDEKTGAFALS